MNKKEVNINELLKVIKEIEREMWDNVHMDNPHKVHQVKTWVDTLKGYLNRTETETIC
jgi:hypothetical protein